MKCHNCAPKRPAFTGPPRRRQRSEATERWVAKHKVACLQLVRQVLPLSMERAFEELSSKSWTTPTVHQVRDWEGGEICSSRSDQTLEDCVIDPQVQAAPVHSNVVFVPGEQLLAAVVQAIDLDLYKLVKVMGDIERCRATRNPVLLRMPWLPAAGRAVGGAIDGCS